MGCIQSAGKASPAAPRDVAGNKKALLVGVNYRGQKDELGGCINDAMNQRTALIEHYGFQESDILMLTEDEAPENFPNKARIQEGFSWLLEGASSGDLLFFAFSGHGSIHEGSECICPLDCDKGWPEYIIKQEEIHDTFYGCLPKGVHCACSFDCCHSGHMAGLSIEVDRQARSSDLQIRYREPPTSVAKPRNPNAGTFRSVAKYEGLELLVFSGCKDDQTSADATIDGVRQGAFTWALLKALRKDEWHAIYHELLKATRENLKLGGYEQDPVLSSTSERNLQCWYLGQELQSAGKASPAAPRDVAGNKKALLVGVNYRGKEKALEGCINDATNQRNALIEHYGFQESDILMLTEDEAPENFPNKARIQEGFSWLLEGASSGDLLFFAFSGHGSIHEGSECICPLDHDKGSPDYIIKQEEIHDTFYGRLPKGVHCACSFDCCHSGHMAGLSIEVDRQARSSNRQIRYLELPTSVAKPRNPNAGTFRSVAKYEGLELLVFSGCKDDQTSTDDDIDGMRQGAFTWALLKALRKDEWHATYHELFKATRENLKLKDYEQDPVLSSTSERNLQCWYLGQELM